MGNQQNRHARLVSQMAKQLHDFAARMDTSSAVVGSSAMSSFGLQASAMAIIIADVFHRKAVRIFMHRVLRGMPVLSSSAISPLPRLGTGHAFVAAQGSTI